MKCSKSSAYKSGFIVEIYKQLGGTYSDDAKPKNLQKWFASQWVDVGGMAYPCTDLVDGVSYERSNGGMVKIEKAGKTKAKIRNLADLESELLAPVIAEGEVRTSNRSAAGLEAADLGRKLHDPGSK